MNLQELEPVKEGTYGTLRNLEDKACPCPNCDCGLLARLNGSEAVVIKMLENGWLEVEDYNGSSATVATENFVPKPTTKIVTAIQATAHALSVLEAMKDAGRDQAQGNPYPPEELDKRRTIVFGCFDEALRAIMPADFLSDEKRSNPDQVQ